MSCHLAQINIARMRAPLDSPLMAPFMAALDAVNALADRSRGFVWRFQSEAGNATEFRPYADPSIIVNLSVWESAGALKRYAYQSEHAGVMRRRHEWFEKFDGPYLALWWVTAGTIPTLAEAQARLEYLRAHGESQYAFSFKRIPEPSAGALTLPAVPA